MCLSVPQEKQSEMEGVKQQLVEVEKQRDEHGDTIEKLKQVTTETEKSDLKLYICKICRSNLQKSLFWFF